MEELFLKVLKMSITSSYVILFVILVRFLLKRFPKIFSYMLWLVVLFRLICPVSFESNISLIPKSNSIILENDFVNESSIKHYVDNIEDTIQNYNNIEENKSIDTSSLNIISLVSKLWIVTIIFMISYSIFLMIKLKKNLKSSIHIKDNIYKLSNINTAFVFGIINPKIYIPKGLSEKQEKYILAHEMVHIKRGDYLIKLISYLALIVHCFNPLVWLSFKLMSKDMEMSCDERVIKEMGVSIKKEYSKALLSCANKESSLKGAPIAFGEEDVKGRIKNVLNYKKPKIFITIILSITIIAIMLLFIFNPIKEIDSSSISKINEDNIKENIIKVDDITDLNEDEFIEKLVYNAVDSKTLNKNKNEFIIIAPKIFGSYEEENKIKIFANIYVKHYIIKEKILELNMGSNIPTAITYSKDKNDNYVLEKYMQAREGSEFSSSIEEFCTMPVSKKPINGLADEIINQYSDNEYFQTLERKNLIKYLNDNRMEGVSLLENFNGKEKLIPLTE